MGVYNQPYKFYEYDLRTVRKDERLGLSGNELIVFKNPIQLELRLDDMRNDKILIGACEQTNPVVIAGITFNDIWMTNEYFDGKTQMIVLFSLAGNQLIEAIKEPKGLDRIMIRLGLYK